MANYTQIKVIVTGRVQGVFFRAHTRRTAELLGVNGYVKNLPDGSVEAVFKADPLSVSKMVAWCRHGPEASIVKQVLTEPSEKLSTFDTFEIRY